MDVETKTTVRAGMDVSGVVQATQQAGDAIQGMANKAVGANDQITQSTTKSTRALLDGGRAFESLARQYVDGYGQTMRYVQAVQTLERATVNGRDALGLMPQILQRIGQQYGFVGEQAVKAALAVAQASTAAQRTQALASLLNMRQPGGTTGTINTEQDQAQIDALRGKYVSLESETQRYGKAVVEILALRNEEVLTSKEAEDALIAQAAAYRLAAVAANEAAQAEANRIEQANRALLGIKDTQSLQSYAVSGAVDRATTDAYSKRQAELEAAFGPALQAGAEQANRQLLGITDALNANQRAFRQSALEAAFPPDLFAKEREAAQQAAAEQANQQRLGVQQPSTRYDQAARQADLEAAFGTTQQASAYDKLRASLDPVFASSKRYEDQLNAISAALDNFEITQTQANELTDRATQSFAAANQPLGNLAQKAEQLAAANDRLRASIDPVFAASKQYEAQLDAAAKTAQAFGLGQDWLAAKQAEITKQFADANAPLDQQAKGAKTLAEQMDALRRSIDPVYASSKRYEEQLDQIAALEAQMGGATAATTKLRDLATESFAKANAPLNQHKNNLESILGLTTQQQFALRQLGVQTTQMFNGFLTGQPIFTTLIQQLHQIIDVNIAAGVSFRDLGAAVGRLAARLLTNPIVLTIGGIAAAIGGITALGIAAERAQERMNDLRNLLSASGKDYVQAAEQADRAAKTLAATTPIGTTDARTLINQVYQSRSEYTNITGQAGEIAKTFYDLSQQLGETMKEAQQYEKQALANPASFAQSMVGRLDAFSQAVATNVQRLQDQGKQGEALALVLKTLAASTLPVKDNVSELQKAWHELSNTMTKAGQDGHSMAENMGASIDNLAAWGIRRLNDLMTKMGEFRDFVTRTTAPTPGGTLQGIQQNGVVAPSFSLPQLPGNLSWLLSLLPFGSMMLPRALPLSSGNQPTAVSSAGALGTMQLMPGTAASLTNPFTHQTINPYDKSENILGGLLYIQQLANMREAQGQLRFGSNEAISAAYNAGPNNYTAGFGYAAKVGGANTANLPTDTVQMIEWWGQRLGLPRELIDLGKRIASVENQGQQGPVAPGRPFVMGPERAGLSGTGQFDAIGTSPQKQLDIANEAIKQSDIINQKLRDNEDQQSKMVAGIAAAQAEQAKMNDTSSQSYQDLTAKIAGYQQRLSDLKHAHEDIQTEQRLSARAADEATRALTAEAGAARDFAEIRVKYQQMARGRPEGVDQVALQTELTAKQRELTAAFNDNIRTMDRQTDAQLKTLDAIKLGGQAADHYINRTQAEIEALKTAEQGTAEYARQVDVLTAAKDRASNVKYDVQAASDIHSMELESEQLDLQLKLLTATTGERNREIAVLQERQKLGLRRGEEAKTQIQQQAIETTKAVADQKTQTQQYQDAMNAVADSVSQSWDTIGNSITQALLQGQGAAVNWRNVMTSVAQQVLQQFLKLAAINPLLNQIFGGNRPTFGTFLDANEGGQAGSGVLTLIGRFLGMSASTAGVAPGAVEPLTGLATTHHTGGVVGEPAPMRLVDASLFYGAPRYHGGLGSDEFAAILQRGERVLTANQDAHMQAVMAGLTSHAANDEGPSPTVVVNFNAPQTEDTFRRAAPQIARQVLAVQTRAMSRNR